MNIFIMNGNPSVDPGGLNRYLGDLTDRLEEGGHATEEMTLRNQHIQPCSGCFGCWIKKPGDCVVRDDTHVVRQKIMNSDLTLMASPLIMGFPSALLKKANDKFLPLIHPYIELVRGECHHRARYDRYPLLGLLVEPEDDTDQEDLDIVSTIYRRFALNFKTRLAFALTTGSAVQEVRDEIDRL